MQAPPIDTAIVIAVHLDHRHNFSKPTQPSIRLLEGLGVEGDAHCGATVKHRYDKRRNPGAPNLRQVHLIQAELFDELRANGFVVAPGELGENISTHGIDLLHLPAHTRLRLGADAIVEITGLRQPCVYIDRFQKGLRSQMEPRSANDIPSKAGVMSVVVKGGVVEAGDRIVVQLPDAPHKPLVFV